jgi:dienelactone hydrolase
MTIVGFVYGQRRADLVLSKAGTAEKDAIAYTAFLDAQKEVDKTTKIGTQGYCMCGCLAKVGRCA